MTKHEYLAQLERAGFDFRPLWEAKETGKRFATVSCFTVYGKLRPDHTRPLLTSLIVREHDGGVFTFWIGETLRIADDVAYLETLDERAAARAG